MKLSPTEEARLQILREAKPNTWIAFNEDESQLVGKGATYAEAAEEALRNGYKDPLITLIPPNWHPLVLCA